VTDILSTIDMPVWHLENNCVIFKQRLGMPFELGGPGWLSELGS